MNKFHCLLLLITAFALSSCNEEGSVGKPLFQFDFNNSLTNSGMAKMEVYGPQSVSYEYGAKDTCLDLSINAQNRYPLTLNFKDVFSLDDYGGFSLSVWLKKYPDDPEEYVVLSQTKADSIGINGWKLIAQESGAWGFEVIDGFNFYEYKPTKKQAINDESWHNIVFTYNDKQEEINFYFDGQKVANYSLFNNHLNLDSIPIIIGSVAASNGSLRELFNGCVDDLALWSRVLTDDDVRLLCNNRKSCKVKNYQLDEQLKMMTWNIKDGGERDGKFVGVQRVVNVIQAENPDVVVLQESGNTSAIIADKLNYLLYQRSDDLCILTRFKISQRHNVYNPKNVGCVHLQLDDEKDLLLCSINLSEEPNIEAYVLNGNASADSIRIWEAETRAKEMQFISSELQHLLLRSNKVPVVLAGGFNCGSHLDWTAKNKERNNGLVVDYPVSKLLYQKGFVDSYRKIHPDETLDYGYTWPITEDSTLFNRKDYLYYKGQNLIPVDSYVVNKYTNGFPSDHAAVVTIFEWNE